MRLPSFGGRRTTWRDAVLVSLAIFTFLGCWNDLMCPLIVLGDDRLYTLPVALSREHVQDSEMMTAGSVVTVLPVRVVFLGRRSTTFEGCCWAA